MIDARARRLTAPIAIILGSLLLIQATRAISIGSHLQNDARLLQRYAEQDATSQSQNPGDMARLVAQTTQDFRELRAFVGPLAPMLPLFGWLPRYGGDLANTPALLEFGERAAASAEETLNLAVAFDAALEAGRAAGTPASASLLRVAQENTATIGAARKKVAATLAARAQINDAQLSPTLREGLTKVDHWLPLWQTSLDLLEYAPMLLGADRPRTLLLIAQNSEELRATGGFLTGVALVRVEQGKITTGDFQDSYAVDDTTRLHPTPPLPLRKYMFAAQWMFRDANWSPDFPTAARQVETLYKFDRNAAIDGVIAVNLKAFPSLIEAMGTITLENNESVDASNVLSKIQTYWAAPQGVSATSGAWAQRKDFLSKLFQVLMRRLMAGEFDRTRFGRAMGDAVASKDILIYLNDLPAAAQTSFPDGSLYQGSGDALMVVDSNVGFNKVDSSIERQIDYTVRLDASPRPQARLVVTYTNLSPADGAYCVHQPPKPTSYAEMQQGCYWDYVRVVVPGASQLAVARGAWDTVTEEPLGQRAVFGGFFFLPRGERLVSSFEYTLPTALKNQGRYTLQLEKQPGAPAIPVRVRIVWPEGWSAKTRLPATFAANTLEMMLVLDRDQQIEVTLEDSRSQFWLGVIGGLIVLIVAGTLYMRFRPVRRKVQR